MKYNDILSGFWVLIDDTKELVRKCETIDEASSWVKSTNLNDKYDWIRIVSFSSKTFLSEELRDIRKAKLKKKIMNEILQTLTEEQKKAVDWMIKNNLQDFCDSVKIGMTNSNTIISKTFQKNGIKVTA